MGIAVKRLRRRARMICRQFQQRRSAGQLISPKIQLLAHSLIVEPVALPLCIVSILDRQGW